MAFGSSNKQGKQDSVFVDLKFKASAGAAGVGFRQTISRTPIEGAVEGEKKFNYVTEMHNFVEGIPVGFVVKEEPTFDDPKINEFIGYATIADRDDGPNVVVKFPICSGAGRKLVGVLSAAALMGDPAIHLYTNQADAGAKIGENVLTKAQAYINGRVGSVEGARIDPVYADENGQPMMEADGKPTLLARGVEHIIAKKSVWDFTAADDMTMNTATALTGHFSKQADGDTDGKPGHEEPAVDLDEAAAAATPQA